MCLVVAAAGSGPSHAAGAEAELTALATGAHRAEGNADRNEYRHPVATLMFFGIEPDMTVVEMTPGGGGWYTEIIAPFVRESGRYYAANYDPVSPVEYYRRNARKFIDKLAENLELYDQTIVTVFAPPNKTDIAPAGSADLVVTFRNTHNWLGVEDGAAEAAFSAMYRALKPGGALGVVQHREDPAKPQDPTGESGYVREDVVIAMAGAAGFRLDARSEINANPNDMKDYAEGVWTLPPNLQLGDEDRDRYMAIGESDRMTLRFVKPAD
ncbi:MAG: methyltransferase [Gammaproteobacteria bacterium]|nr:methyltransferase [Gammaproteobacteria bacterium]MBT8445112.1 methyltransferase [Gammaproteobacteria bacterium]